MGEAKDRREGRVKAPDMKPKEVDPAYVRTAMAAQASFADILESLEAMAPGQNAAIASGAIVALTRFFAAKVIAPFGFVTTRSIFSAMLPAINKAAEGYCSELDNAASKEDQKDG